MICFDRHMARLLAANGVRVDADNQRLRLERRGVHDSTAIASTQIHDRPLVAPDQVLDLSDVDLC